MNNLLLITGNSVNEAARKRIKRQQQRIKQLAERRNAAAKKAAQPQAAQPKKKVDRVNKQFRGHVGRAMNDRRSRWVDDISENATRKQQIILAAGSETFARMSRHPVFGLPILFLFLDQNLNS